MGWNEIYRIGSKETRMPSLKESSLNSSHKKELYTLR